MYKPEDVYVGYVGKSEVHLIDLVELKLKSNAEFYPLTYVFSLNNTNLKILDIYTLVVLFRKLMIEDRQYKLNNGLYV